MLEKLPSKKREYYVVKNGRKKYHEKEKLSYEQKMAKAKDIECLEIEAAIDAQNGLVKFIGEVKSMTFGKMSY